MKKKLFFLLAMVATLVCLLAVTVFAENQPDNSKGTVTLSDGTVCALYDEEGDALIWYISGTETVGETTKNVYSYIEAKDSAVTLARNGTYQANHPTPDQKKPYYKQISNLNISVNGTTYTGKSHVVVANLKGATLNVTNDSTANNPEGYGFEQTFKGSKVLEYLYLPLDTIAIQKEGLNGCTALKYVNLEECTELRQIVGQGLAGCTSLFAGMELDLSNTKITHLSNGSFTNCKMTGIVLPNTLRVLDAWALQYMTNVKEIHIPESVTSFSETMFTGCTSLEKVTGFAALFERGVLTAIPKQTFVNCSSLKELDMPTTGYTAINEKAFQYCDNLFTGVDFVVPETCTTIGQSAFEKTNIVTIRLNGTYTTIIGNAFRECTNLATIYLPASVTVVQAEGFRQIASNTTIFFVGDKATAETLKANVSGDLNGSGKSYNDAIVNATVLSLEEYNALENKNGRYLVYGVNKCFAFYDNKHTLTGTDCTVDDACKICTLPIEAQAGHDKVEKLVYPNGFTQAGVYTCDCIFNGCTVIDIKAGDEGSEAAALFNGGEGFSTKGDDGIAGGYTIDVDAVEKYKEINGSLTMGIMVVNPNYYYGKDSFFDATGKINTTGGAIQVELVDNQYKNVSVAITGFTGNAESVSLVIALYAYEDVENVEFIQSSTTACGDKNVTVGGKTLYTVTLASVKAGNSDLSNLGDYEIPKKDEE